MARLGVDYREGRCCRNNYSNPGRGGWFGAGGGECGKIGAGFIFKVDGKDLVTEWESGWEKK